jgi:hypothetical protein
MSLRQICFRYWYWQRVFQSVLSQQEGKPLKKLETNIKIRGEFNKVLDLAIDGGLPIPVVVHTGFTEFATLLEAGQGIIYRLD